MHMLEHVCIHFSGNCFVSFLQGMTSHLDALKKSLGPALIAAVAEVCSIRPRDPIEFIAQHLKSQVRRCTVLSFL